MRARSTTTIKFPVQWRRFWKSLTIYLSLAITVPISAVMAIHVVRKGYAEAFRHLGLLEAVLLLIGMVVFSAACSFLLAQYARIAAVTLDGELLIGRNYWGFRRHIPLSDIARMYPFSHNGVSFVVVASNFHGEIYIFQQTENLEHLLELLQTYVPAAPGSQANFEHRDASQA